MKDISGIQLRTGEIIPLSLLDFSTSRSGGPGGQHANKTETKVEVRLKIDELTELSERTVSALKERLGGRILSDGTIRVTNSSGRSQYANKIAAILALEELLNQALKPKKKRIRTRPSKASRLKRLEEKRRKAEKKASRRWKPE